MRQKRRGTDRQIMTVHKKNKTRDADHFVSDDVGIAELVQQACLNMATEYMYGSGADCEGGPVLSTAPVSFERECRQPVYHASLSFVRCNRALNMLVSWLGPVSKAGSVRYGRAS